MAHNTLTTDSLLDILNTVYCWSEKQDFRGYNKHDGLNSPILNVLLGWGKWARIFAIQSVMRSPINVRPVLGVKKTYNPKGIALFCQGSLDLYQCTGNDTYLQQAKAFLELLKQLASPGNWSGICWGYHYPWQDPGFFAPTNTPNAVVSCFVCEAFLDAYKITYDKNYLEIVNSAIQFFLNDLMVLKDTKEELCMAYMPLPMTMRVMDVSILIGAVIVCYSQYAGNSEYLNTANRLVRYVVSRQTDYAAWYYTDPPGDSHITHDNYHTGFILDALSRYMNGTGNYAYQTQYDRGLKFYAKELFNPDGSPRWMNNKNYPHDVHGAAQGIITFARHLNNYPEMAENIARWAINHLYNESGRFYYQKTRFFTKRFTLLRWCNAWMYRALASLCLKIKMNRAPTS
jgi:hypothetical protein